MLLSRDTIGVKVTRAPISFCLGAGASRSSSRLLLFMVFSYIRWNPTCDVVKTTTTSEIIPSGPGSNCLDHLHFYRPQIMELARGKPARARHRVGRQ